MNKRSVGLFTLGTLMGFSASPAPGAENLYEVASWKGFAEAAITYTFDDATSNQYSIAIPLLDEFGFAGTFYPVVNWNPDWEEFQRAVHQGHEIGSHTLSHPHLSTLSYNEQIRELLLSQESINAHITGEQCRTIAYSYCDPSADSLTRKYYLAARNCQGRTEKSTPDDFMNISSIVCGEQGRILTAEQFEDIAFSAAASGGWNVFLLHGIDDDGGYSPLSSTVLRSSLEFFDLNRNRFWVSNFVNVVRYIQERDAVTITESYHYADSIGVVLHDSLDDTIYNYPLTLRRPLPEDWEWVVAIQGGKTLETVVKEKGNIQYIEFNAVPDAGLVVLYPAPVPAKKEVFTKERNF